MTVKAGMRSRVAQAGRQAGRHHQQSTDDDDRDELEQCSTDIVSGSKYWEHNWPLKGWQTPTFFTKSLVGESDLENMAGGKQIGNSKEILTYVTNKSSLLSELTKANVLFYFELEGPLLTLKIALWPRNSSSQGSLTWCFPSFQPHLVDFLGRWGWSDAKSSW